VLANLVANAVRHSPAGGTVSLRGAGDDGHVRIEVADEGPGIPSSDAERVFERFYRADQARSATEGGSGLGLAIARWIVELHGGAIRVEQAQPHGCRMVVELPR
jgi:signal transduction histidine kinase